MRMGLIITKDPILNGAFQLFIFFIHSVLYNTVISLAVFEIYKNKETLNDEFILATAIGCILLLPFVVSFQAGIQYKLFPLLLIRHQSLAFGYPRSTGRENNLQ